MLLIRVKKKKVVCEACKQRNRKQGMSFEKLRSQKFKKKKHKVKEISDFKFKLGRKGMRK